MPTAASPVFLDGVDLTRKFVRVTGERRDGAFVEFDFAIGWPELSVELVLPRAAFESFCAEHAVTFLPPPALNAVNTPRFPYPDDDEETTP
jgi:phenol hydroxylase P0 protein